MIQLCNWFDRYRDGELDPEQLHRYQLHLRDCDKCREKSFLLTNLVQALKLRDLSIPVFRPGQIARHAFENSGSWDVLLVSLLRPFPAWFAFAMLLIVFSLVSMFPGTQPAKAYGEYEMLMMESDPGILGGSTPQVQTDEELTRWLERGGNSL